MKIIKFLLIGLLPFLVSCSNVLFEKPMPIDGKNLKSFTKSLIGSYYVTDSIFDSSIYNEKYYADIYKLKDSVKTGIMKVDISKDSIVYSSSEKSYYDTTKINLENITIEPPTSKSTVIRRNIGKYVMIEINESEKLVDLTTKDILKEKDGFFYVNIKDGDNEWYLFQLKRKKKDIILVNELDEDKFDKLPKNFNYKSEVFTTYMYDMTIDKFDYLVKHHYFRKFFELKKY